MILPFVSLVCQRSMTEKNINIVVDDPRKKYILAACVALLAAGVCTIAVTAGSKSSDNKPKSQPVAAPATTTASVSQTQTTVTTTTTATSLTVTTAPAPTEPSEEDIQTLAGGTKLVLDNVTRYLKEAEKNTESETEQETDEPQEETPEETPDEQEEQTPDETQGSDDEPSPSEPEYFTEDGASDMTIYYLNYINKQRESSGLPPFHASGQLDKAVLDSLHVERGWGELASDPYSKLSDVGLPSSCEITMVYGWAFHYDTGEDPLKKCLDALHRDFPHDDFNGSDLVHGMRDYTYLSVVYYPDSVLDKAARDSANEWYPYEGQQYGIRIYAMK